MSTITISISDDQLARLQLLARESGVEPETFLQQQVNDWLEKSDESFERAATAVFEKNAELYRRLS